MDIMNNMTVSTSKFTFSLIAIAALLISGSGFLVQDAYAFGKASDAPEFTASHINQTATKITFDNPVNGTLRVLDWAIKLTSTAVLTDAGGSQTTDATGTDGAVITITDVTNGTTSGVTLNNGYLTTAYSSISSTANKLHSWNYGTDGDNTGLGFINNSRIIILMHSEIPSDSTYFVNYTNNVNSANENGALTGYFPVAANTAYWERTTPVEYGTNNTAVDMMGPTAVSADILKSNPSQVRITMSETIAVVNSTISAFSLTTAGGGNDAVPASISGDQNLTKYIYVNLQNPALHSDTLTISYNQVEAGSSQAGGNWITDAINSLVYYSTTAKVGTFPTLIAGITGQTNDGVGNRIGNFTGLSVTNWLELGMYGDVTTCYDCDAPIVTDVKVSLDSSSPITVNDDNKVHVNAGIGDTVSVMVTVADNLGADTIPFAGIYTNFGDTPDNLYYSNNFDGLNQKSTSYYEWNVRNDDVAFDNDGAITWSDATAKVNADRTQTFTFTMTLNDSIESSQVWVDIGDKVGNYAKVSLPITLEVSGAPGITFASDDSQKVVSFFNESILLAIVSQWTATSSDDASNVEQLSSVLGIESQLPTWTTDLASWVADDKIDVADMIVAVEYVINQ
jgi:hypothetical protein